MFAAIDTRTLAPRRRVSRTPRQRHDRCPDRRPRDDPGARAAAARAPSGGSMPDRPLVDDRASRAPGDGGGRGPGRRGAHPGLRPRDRQRAARTCTWPRAGPPRVVFADPNEDLKRFISLGVTRSRARAAAQLPRHEAPARALDLRRRRLRAPLRRRRPHRPRAGAAGLRRAHRCGERAEHRRRGDRAPPGRAGEADRGARRGRGGDAPAHRGRTSTTTPRRRWRPPASAWTG